MQPILPRAMSPAPPHLTRYVDIKLANKCDCEKKSNTYAIICCWTMQLFHALRLLRWQRRLFSNSGQKCGLVDRNKNLKHWPPADLDRRFAVWPAGRLTPQHLRLWNWVVILLRCEVRPCRQTGVLMIRQHGRVHIMPCCIMSRNRRMTIETMTYDFAPCTYVTS